MLSYSIRKLRVGCCLQAACYLRPLVLSYICKLGVILGPIVQQYLQALCDTSTATDRAMWVVRV